MSRLPSTLNHQQSTLNASPARTLLLRARVKLPMHRLEPLLIDMRVDLRRRNIGVPEHFLNNPQIGTVAEEMRRKTVPEQMGINVFLQAGVARFFLHNLPDSRGC